MVSPSKPHHSRVASQAHLHKCKLVKGPKPLTHFKFYLDIEKHQIGEKIEKQIKELGGSIEYFLVKKSTHFVTDKPIDRDGNLLSVSHTYLSPSSLFLSQTKTPSPARQTKPASIQSLNDLNNSDEKAACSRPKSRADAMVQRARTSTPTLDSASTQSQLQNTAEIKLALSYGTQIWNTDYTLKFLEKVSLALKLESTPRTTSSTKSSHHHHHHHQHHHHHHHKTANVKHLNGEYIKIESSQKHYRPYYQEFSSWPTINFDCNLCPFQTQSDKTIPRTKNFDNPNGNLKNTNDDSVKVKIRSNATINANSITEVTAGSVPISILAKNNITNIIESTMTRKTRNKQVREAAIDACSIKTNNDDVKPNSEKCGYCEKCRVEYDVLASHLQSKEHLNFVKNNDNYIALDSLINSGTNVENFLRINSGQMIDETERNGVQHSPRKDSLISSRVNYLSHTTSYATEHKSDANTAVVTQVKTTHKQMNGIVHHTTDDLSPSKVNNIREKLPKYSPPITRRSQTKNAIQTIIPDNTDQHNNETPINSKFRPDKVNNSITVDFREDEISFISKADNDVQTKSPSKQGKVTINGRTKKCDEQPINHINDESPVLPKRLVRAFPRYKVIDGAPKATTNERTTKYSKTNALNKSIELNAEKELTDCEKGIKDPITGLTVKLKRVRETELSKLTEEADNFMFPKREEQPTDEDRQSTSERDGDASLEIPSSEVDCLRDTSSLNALQNSNLNFSATSDDQFTSSGRRKKRRTQFDNFKSPAQKKQKFRASLIQSRLNSTKTATTPTSATTNGSQTPVKLLGSRGAKLSAAKITTTGRGRRGKKQRNSTSTVTIEAQTDNSLDDRMGENTYIGGKLLATDYFQNLKFSFERVPSNEPWYLTFQRQDEHRERMFEYWGNTAYRKLPYELGPLPPLDPDCCLLSKLTAIKATKQQKNRRSTKSSIPVPVEVTNTSKLTTTTTTSEENAVSSSNCITTSNTPAQKSNAISRTCDTESDNERRPQTSTLSQLLLADSSLNSISLPAAISNKKKTMLLDAFGQPRKSPREHASTLAILSSLVQQRRKRIKEINGGISPEKLPSYKAAVAAAIAAQHSADVSESEELMDECDSRLQLKATTEMETRPMSSRRRSNQTPVFEINKGTVDGNVHQSNGGYHAMEQSDKIFRLRKGKRRQTESVSSNNESISGKNDKTDDTTTAQTTDNNDKMKDHIDIPKMPVDEYVDPNKTARDLDDLLSNCYLDADNDLNDIPVDCSDLILVNSSKDFVEIIESVKDGPLTYRSLQRGKKRHINKTGWPSLPKKRLPKREKVGEKDDLESALSDVQNCESSHSDTENDLNDVAMDCDNDNSNHVLENTSKNVDADIDADDTIESAKNSPVPFRSVSRRRRRNTNKTGRTFDFIDDDNDEEKSRALRHDRRKIRTPFCDDNAVQFVVSASSSEKAETSDIFTVSSDSYLDTDVNNDTVTTVKSRLSADSRSSIEDEGSMSDETTVNNESNWHCRSSLRRSNSIADEVSKPQKGFPSIEESAASTATTTTTTTTTAAPIVTTSILERTLMNMSTRSKFLRSPTLVKGTTIDLNLQPLVCVQKIADKDLPPQKHWINNLSSTTTTTTTAATATGAAAATGAAHESEVVKPNNRISSSPKTKTSPRKLRKPRGRWYRER